MPLVLYSTLTAPEGIERYQVMTGDALVPHLQGFSGYVWQQAGQKMTPVVWAVLEHIRRTRSAISLPEDVALPAAIELASQWNALIFDHGRVLNHAGSVLLGTDGDAPAVECPYPASAKARKARSLIALARAGTPSIPHLPPTPSEEEVILRDDTEATHRLFCALTVAVVAEGLSSADALDIATALGIEDSFTPREYDFLAGTASEEQVRVQMLWRYEAAAMLAWCLQLWRLGDPSTIIDCAAFVRALNEATQSRTHLPRARLRAMSDLLDARDLLVRQQWALTDARIKQQPPPSGLDPGVVVERLHAIQWILCHHDNAWDEALD